MKTIIVLFMQNILKLLPLFFNFHPIAYEGKYCEDDFDGCTEISCFNDATCTDVPAPGTGATCPPCPSGYTGDGLICDGQ